MLTHSHLSRKEHKMISEKEMSTPDNNVRFSKKSTCQRREVRLLEGGARRHACARLRPDLQERSGERGIVPKSPLPIVYELDTFQPCFQPYAMTQLDHYQRFTEHLLATRSLLKVSTSVGAVWDGARC